MISGFNSRACGLLSLALLAQSLGATAQDSDTMRAVMWEGNPSQVAVRDIPKPVIQIATDAIIQVTTAAICGTDLHIYHGVFGGSEVPYSLGHEAIGIITEVGSAVQRFKVGDRVVVPTDPNPNELLGNAGDWTGIIQQLRDWESPWKLGWHSR